MTNTNDTQINIRVPKELHKKAKKKAIDEDRSLQEVLEEFIRQWVKENGNEPKAED